MRVSSQQEMYLIQGLVSWLINATALIITSRLIPSMSLDGFGTALVAALLLALVNALLLPLLTLLTLPITVLSLGIFWLVLNGAMLKLTAALVSGFRVSWLGAIFGAILLTMIQAALRWAFKQF